MKELDLKYICRTIGNLSGIPIRIFENEQRIFYYDLIQLPKDPVFVYIDEIMKVNDHIGYFITNHFNYYGIVNSGNIKLVLGPTRQTDGSEQEYHDLAFRADVAPDDIEDFISAMKSIVHMPFESILQILCTLNYILNNEKRELKDITIYDTAQTYFLEDTARTQARESFSQLIEEMNASQENHNSFAQEQLLMSYIRRGDTEAFQKWSASAPAVRGGTIAKEQLRQMKNIFIVSATLASRSAIQGGMNTEDALSLSDAFIQKCELLNTSQQIYNLQYHMILYYTEEVKKIHDGKYSSKLAHDVAEYVHRHLSKPVNTEELARELYMSRPYLSARFKEETGTTLTDFILLKKIDEAKYLLRYTDKTATIIGAYLGFSSQSHFSRVFKKYIGLTPREYRKKYF